MLGEADKCYTPKCHTKGSRGMWNPQVFIPSRSVSNTWKLTPPCRAFRGSVLASGFERFGASPSYFEDKRSIRERVYLSRVVQLALSRNLTPTRARSRSRDEKKGGMGGKNTETCHFFHMQIPGRGSFSAVREADARPRLCAVRFSNLISKHNAPPGGERGKGRTCVTCRAENSSGKFCTRETRCEKSRQHPREILSAR